MFSLKYLIETCSTIVVCLFAFQPMEKPMPKCSFRSFEIFAVCACPNELSHFRIFIHKLEEAVWKFACNRRSIQRISSQIQHQTSATCGMQLSVFYDVIICEKDSQFSRCLHSQMQFVFVLNTIWCWPENQIRKMNSLHVLYHSIVEYRFYFMVLC